MSGGEPASGQIGAFVAISGERVLGGDSIAAADLAGTAATMTLTELFRHGTGFSSLTLAGVENRFEVGAVVMSVLSCL